MASRIVWLFPALLALCLLWPTPGQAQQSEAGFVQLIVNDRPPLAFFPVRIDDRERPYLQFNALMSALEVPATFEPSLGAALGFMPDGTTRFELSLERRTVLVGDVRTALEPDDVLLVDQQLYVLHSAVPRWLPVSLDWSVQAYQVRVQTEYRLPSTLAQMRQSQRRALAQALADAPTAEQLEREIPWFDPGMSELTASGQGGHGNPDTVLLNLKGVHRFLKGDLEYSLTQSQINGEVQDPLADYARLTYYDPLRTWQVQLGDTFSGFSPLVLETVSFRGGSFHTGGRQLRFGRTTLIGNAPPGSEVDLLRQGVLLAFTRADARGFYRFENVPLAVDANLFEVHIFTPQGRKLVEFKQVAAQEEMLDAGRFASLGAVGSGDQGVSSFDLSGGEVRYGVTPWLTLGAYTVQLQNYVVSFETIAELNAVGAFAMVRPAPWLVLLAEQAQDSDVEGDGQRLSAFLAFQPVSLELEQRTYSEDFAPPQRDRSTEFSEPERVDTLNAVTARTRLFNTNLELRNELSDFGAERSANGVALRADRRFGSRLSGLLLLEQVRTEEPDFPEGGFDDLQLLATYRLGILERLEGFHQQRSTVAGLESGQTRASWLKNADIGSPWAWELSYIVRDAFDDLAVGALGYLMPWGLRANARVQSDGTWLASLEYTLPFRVSGDGFETLPQGTFGRAGLAGTVYVDANANGTREPNEPGVSDIQLLVPGISGMSTDADGRFRGWGLPAGAPVALELDLLTADALHTPSEKRKHLAPRPGELVRLDVALVPSSGMDGRLVFAGGGDVSPAEGLELVLRRSDGSEEARARVEWDGAFIFEGIAPGVYTLEADAAAFAERGLALEPERYEVVFPPSPDPAWQSGIELRLVRER